VGGQGPIGIGRRAVLIIIAPILGVIIIGEEAGEKEEEEIS